jgi:Spy/CpxP family protein refolding chaperone
MKKNKYKVLPALALGGLLALGPAVHAQVQTNSPPVPGQRGSRLRQHFAKVVQELKLTGEQKSKIRAVFQSEREKIKALRTDASLTRAQRRAEVWEIRADFIAQMKGILTAEQFEKWLQIREETKQRVRERIRERLGKTGEPG